MNPMSTSAVLLKPYANSGAASAVRNRTVICASTWSNKLGQGFESALLRISISSPFERGVGDEEIVFVEVGQFEAHGFEFDPPEGLEVGEGHEVGGGVFVESCDA